MQHQVVFLFDVDNTLFDNDHLTRDLQTHLREAFGPECERRYWAIFEEIRGELGYADYLGALQRYRIEHPRDPHVLRVSSFLIDYPFAERLFAGAVEAVGHAQQWGPAVILSDGDVVFQPHKIERSGLLKAAHEQVLIYVHKEHMLDHVEERFPAQRYIVIDDKVRILAAIKEHWGARVTTVFPRQGHYALNAQEVARYPAPDIALESIGAFLERLRRCGPGAQVVEELLRLTGQ